MLKIKLVPVSLKGKSWILILNVFILTIYSCLTIQTKPILYQSQCVVGRVLTQKALNIFEENFHICCKNSFNRGNLTIVPRGCCLARSWTVMLGRSRACRMKTSTSQDSSRGNIHPCCITYRQHTRYSCNHKELFSNYHAQKVKKICVYTWTVLQIQN